jgi:hypothetical protein
MYPDAHPYSAESRRHAAMRNDEPEGEHMEDIARSPVPTGRCSMESHRELEATLHSLRLLICDLLRENQVLRAARLAERSETTPGKKALSGE